MTSMKEEERRKRELHLCDCYRTLCHVAKAQGVHENDIEELVQDTMAIACMKIHQLSCIEKMDGWLFTILKRRLFLMQKKQQRQNKFCRYEEDEGLHLEDIPAVDYDGLYDAMDKLLDNSELLEMINELKVPAPQIIKLSFFEGYSLKEIAQMLSMNYNTVRSIQARALKTLRKRICEKKGGAI